MRQGYRRGICEPHCPGRNREPSFWAFRAAGLRNEHYCHTAKMLRPKTSAGSVDLRAFHLSTIIYVRLNNIQRFFRGKQTVKKNAHSACRCGFVRRSARLAYHYSCPSMRELS